MDVDPPCRLGVSIAQARAITFVWNYQFLVLVASTELFDEMRLIDSTRFSKQGYHLFKI